MADTLQISYVDYFSAETVVSFDFSVSRKCLSLSKLQCVKLGTISNINTFDLIKQIDEYKGFEVFVKVLLIGEVNS